MKAVAGELTRDKKESLTDKIHDAILEMVIKLPEGGEQVLTEGRLMEMFGVSKAPVREALVRLCSEGILKNVPRFGYVIVQMEEKDEQDVKRIRMLLETEALKEGFDDIVCFHLPKIEQQLNREGKREEIRDVWTIWKDNEEFHLLLASYAKNQVLSRFLEESLQIHKRAYAQIHWKRENTLRDKLDYQAHFRIYEALCKKNLEESICALREDIMS